MFLRVGKVSFLRTEVGAATAFHLPSIPYGTALYIVRQLVHSARGAGNVAFPQTSLRRRLAGHDVCMPILALSDGQ